jgi:hypothetical protein
LLHRLSGSIAATLARKAKLAIAQTHLNRSYLQNMSSTTMMSSNLTEVTPFSTFIGGHRKGTLP